MCLDCKHDGMKEWGFDPLAIEWALAFVEMPKPEAMQTRPTADRHRVAIG